MSEVKLRFVQLCAMRGVLYALDSAGRVWSRRVEGGGTDVFEKQWYLVGENTDTEEAAD